MNIPEEEAGLREARLTEFDRSVRRQQNVGSYSTRGDHHDLESASAIPIPWIFPTEGERTFDVSMNLVLVVKVLETEEKFSTNNRNVGFRERTRFEL